MTASNSTFSKIAITVNVQSGCLSMNAVHSNEDFRDSRHGCGGISVLCHRQIEHADGKSNTHKSNFHTQSHTTYWRRHFFCFQKMVRFSCHIDHCGFAWDGRAVVRASRRTETPVLCVSSSNRLSHPANVASG